MPIEHGSHYPGPSTILVDVGVARQGYGWIFPKQRCLSVGVGEFRRKSTSLRKTFDRFVHGEPGLPGRNVPRPMGHPIPAFSESTDERSRKARYLRSSAAGRCWSVMRPIWSIPCLEKEFIMPFVRGNWRRRHSVEQARTGCPRWPTYEAALDREIVPDFRVTARIAKVIYTFPRLGFKLLHRYQDIVQSYYGVLQGRTSPEHFLTEAKTRLKASVNDLLLEALHLR